MTNQQGPQQPKFTIKRIQPGEQPKPASPSVPPASTQPPERPAEQTQTTPPGGRKDSAKKKLSSDSGEYTGGLFQNANGVLAFLGSALGTGLSDEATVRRGPKGQWWGEVRVSYERTAQLVWTAGGRPYANLDHRWLPISLSSEFPTTSETKKILNVSQWPVLDLAHLLAETSLLPGSYRGAAALDVVAPGVLGRWILRRATTLGLEVTLIPALRRALGNKSGNESGALILKLRAGKEKTIHAALVHSLTQLPYVIVGEPFELANRGVLVDVRHRLPLSPAIFLGMIPDGETWVLGPPDSGHWRVRKAGAEVDGAALMEAPTIPIIDMPAEPHIPKLGQINVHVVPRPGVGSHIDAVLLDESELGWLRHFLMGRPIGETSFLLPGPECYLLTAPGGLPGAIPFGTPLVQVGPGGLYLELGTDFQPPLPDSARQARFGLTDDTAVVVVREAAYRFHTSQMVPAWTLWVGDSPAITEGLSRGSEQLLKRISHLIRQQEVEQALPPFMVSQQRPVNRKERARLLEQAQRAEMAGDLVGAAQMLERAGYPGPAGRLYERAAARR